MQKNTSPGKFIVFEGLDGSGQTTQAGLLKAFLEERGHRVLLTKEPTSSSGVAPKIRAALDKRETAKGWLLQQWFVQDRREHLEGEIIPALQAGQAVISDRYFFSTFAFGQADGLAIDRLIELNQDFLLPDIAFLLEVKPEICMERIEGRGRARTRFEELKKLRKVALAYEEVAKRFEVIKKIKGEQPIKEVFSDVRREVLSQLNL